ncbi:MAG: hypothetical protein K6C33_01195 [Desulfovibrio sp.]|jgi:hypothetical protein|nr:hypothetical protein [Desulfovibrio sp.]
MLAILTLMHFAVDGVCAAELYLYELAEPDWLQVLFVFGLYNAAAFGFQWLAGLALDLRPAFRPALALSVCLLALGCIGAFGAPLRAGLLGAGNCLFHAAGGAWVLSRHPSTYSEPGIFVSSGAVGLALGLAGMIAPAVFLALCAVCAGFACWGMGRVPAQIPMSPAEAAPGEPASDEAALAKTSGGRLVPFLLGGCVLVLLACVVLRGFGGGGRCPGLPLLFPCVFALGKACGGLVCDRFGLKATALAVFLLCFLALQFGGLVPALLLAFAFNMTMPLTLRLAHWCFPKAPGLIFGLAAGCLLPGYFFKDALALPPQAMAVLVFLGLFLAGSTLARFGRLPARPARTSAKARPNGACGAGE